MKMEAQQMQIRIKLSNEEGTQDFEGNDLTAEQTDKLIDMFVRNVNSTIAVQAESIFPFNFDNLKDAIAFENDGNSEEEYVEQEESIAESLVSTDEIPVDEDIPYQYQPPEVVKKDLMSNFYKPEVHQSVYSTAEAFGTSIGDKMSEALSKLNPVAKLPERFDTPAEYKPSGVTKSYSDTQDHFVTGIKYKTLKGVDRVPHYKCRWICSDPVCQDRGNHYIPEGSEVVYCYTCNKKMKVKEATSMGFPNRDGWGNFYTAYEEA